MRGTPDADECERAATRAEILALLDEYCRGLTLRDVRERHDEAFSAADRDSLRHAS